MTNLPLNKLKQIAKNRSFKALKTNLNWWSETDEDHYKPIKTKSAFNANYIEYESKGVKDKNLSPREYLDIITPFLSNMISDHKTTIEWKIQLIMQINFISHSDSILFHILNLISISDSEKLVLCIPTAVI